MYICICNAVTDRDVRDAVLRDGARRLDQLEELLLVGTGCGKCRDTAEACLRATLHELGLHEASVPLAAPPAPTPPPA